jgi:hypothetical protein
MGTNHDPRGTARRRLLQVVLAALCGARARSLPTPLIPVLLAVGRQTGGATSLGELRNFVDTEPFNHTTCPRTYAFHNALGFFVLTERLSCHSAITVSTDNFLRKHALGRNFPILHRPNHDSERK